LGDREAAIQKEQAKVWGYMQADDSTKMPGHVPIHIDVFCQHKIMSTSKEHDLIRRSDGQKRSRKESRAEKRRSERERGREEAGGDSGQKQSGCGQTG
jgi:hypothetical protein